MKTEISAGGVIVKKYLRKWQVLLLKDMNQSWTFPKGLIEKDENPKEAAEREIAEEVGITNVKFLQRLENIEYWYKRNGLIHKTVHYFLFEVTDNPKIRTQKEEGISDARWFDIKKALEIIGYPKTNIPLLELTAKKLHIHFKA